MRNRVFVIISLILPLAIARSLNEFVPYSVIYEQSGIFENISAVYFSYIDEVYNNLQGQNTNVSEQCLNDTRFLFTFAKRGDSDALKFLDATGKPISGILEGGVSFLGFYSQCVTAKIHENTSKNTRHSVYGEYCLVSLSISNSSKNSDVPIASWTIFTKSEKKPVIGFCVPSSCSIQDINYAVTTGAEKMLFGSSASVSVCYSKTNNFAKDNAALCILSLFVLCIIIVVCATIYDIFLKHMKTNLRKNANITEAVSTDMLCEVNEPVRPTTFQRCILSFSFWTNAEKILTVNDGASSNIQALHGLRFLTMSLIIFGHTFSFGTQNLFLRNPGNALQAPKDFLSQTFANGTIAVDTFYLISGLLVALVTLRVMAKRDGKIPLLYFYLHRYFRLTPLMMAIIAFCATLLRYIGSGPNWLSAIQMYDVWCKKNWWTNALYLHNFINTDNMCLAHSWYLATDMQFYLLTPLILIPLYRNVTWGFLVLLLFFLCTTLTTAILTALKHFPAIPYINNAVPLNIMNDYYREVYIKPYCRMGPYLVGIAVGYILVNKKELYLKKKYVITLWISALALGLAVIYLMWPANQGNLPTPLEAAAYSSLARSVWALCLGWLVIACVYGYAGFINTLLSWAPLIPLSRLTYCAYLIHPVVMNAYYGCFETTLDFSYSFVIYLFLGNIVSTYILSFFITLVFESPFVGLEKAILSRT